MIYKEYNEHSFAYELSDNKDNGFSYEGAQALYNYFEINWLEMEFDAVALRCEYSEYTEEEIVADYAYLLEEEEGGDREEYIEMLIEIISDNTSILTVDNDTYIIQNF